jgi:hypothetical protein
MHCCNFARTQVARKPNNPKQRITPMIMPMGLTAGSPEGVGPSQPTEPPLFCTSGAAGAAGYPHRANSQTTSPQTPA